MKISISSLQSFGTKDGPGIRYVLFLNGCPLRCCWCHNPETQGGAASEKYSDSDLIDKILRCRDYYGQDGGVTFSGGEPLLQAREILPLMERLKQKQIHIALDTSGFALNQYVVKAISSADLVMLSIKGFSENEYRENTGFPVWEQTLRFLEELQKQQKKVRLRYLLVPGRTDSDWHLRQLATLEHRYSCVQEVELIGFCKLCIEKYQELGRAFALSETPEVDRKTLSVCREKYQQIRNLHL